MPRFDKAEELIREFQGDRYIFGSGVLGEAGRVTRGLGQRAALVYDGFLGNSPFMSSVRSSLAAVKMASRTVVSRAKEPALPMKTISI